MSRPYYPDEPGYMAYAFKDSEGRIVHEKWTLLNRSANVVLPDDVRGVVNAPMGDSVVQVVQEWKLTKTLNDPEEAGA